ncbi:MAG: HlyD family type I secretion periplasmic adaptor subunit [Gammaproteobacteria bacterium]|nr:HlyD family type I secretion periplasmic adaptor subunit [Gammaproteobacteria bacterium]MDP6166907.1 HlyD family type I secretion periplasmic adaptor subunit [Gammaproteobacteria bacterium]
MKKNRLSNSIFYIISLFFIGAVYWAFETEIDQVVRAEAQVEPFGKVQVVQNRYPGSISRFSVAIGDQVKEGDVLFWLKHEDTEAAIKANRITYFNALAKTARFTAESQGTSLEFAKSIPAKIVVSQESIYLAKQASLQKQIQIITQEVAGKRNAILQAQAAVSAAQDTLALVIEEIAIYEPLVKQGIEPKVRLIGLNKQKEEAKNTIKQQLLAESGLDIQIDTLLRRQQQVDMEFKVEAKEQLAESISIAERAEAEHQALLEKQSMSEVRSPATGVISALHVTTEGAVVGAGETLAEIVPRAESYMVLAKIKPEDISLVNVGQACKVSFTAYDFARYGSITGEVMQIAQNTTETPQGLLYYEVWVKTLTKQFSKSDIVPNIMPGMVAQVDVLGDKQRIVDYVLSPLRRTASIALTEQ